MMQTTAGKDENGFDVEPDKSEITVQKASKREQPQRLRSFVAVSLYTVMFVGIFAVGWVYMGSKSLSQAFGDEQSVADGLEAIGEKIKLLENKIANLQSLSETCDAEHKPLAVQNQKLVETNTTLIAKNNELRIRFETLSDQFDKVNEVYLKRLVAMENVISVTSSAALLEAAPPVVVEREVVVSAQGQDPDEELVNKNKFLAAQNEDIVRRVEELTGQLDKVNEVYLKRLAAMEKPADNSALIAENKELVQMVASLDGQLEQASKAQQELIAELERQNASSVAANTVSVAEDVLVAKQETIAAKPEAEGQGQALADVNAALVIQYEELVKKVTSLNDQMDKSNKVYRRQLTERETQSTTVFATTTRPAANKVQRRWPARTPKTQGPAPWKGTSVAEMLANVRPAAKNK